MVARHAHPRPPRSRSRAAWELASGRANGAVLPP
jgi:hypothetical protein